MIRSTRIGHRFVDGSVIRRRMEQKNLRFEREARAKARRGPIVEVTLAPVPNVPLSPIVYITLEPKKDGDR